MNTHWRGANDYYFRRFLRARKFDVDGAWGQFKDTEDWRRDNAIESLYENIDVDSYDAARRMVRELIYMCMAMVANVFLSSIPNGPVVETAAVFPSTFLRSSI